MPKINDTILYNGEFFKITYIYEKFAYPPNLVSERCYEIDGSFLLARYEFDLVRRLNGSKQKD